MLKQSLEHNVPQCSEFCKCLKNVRGPITEHVLTYARGKMPGGFTDIAEHSLQNGRISGASAIHERAAEARERARSAKPEKSADFSGLALRAPARVSRWLR